MKKKQTAVELFNEELEMLDANFELNLIDKKNYWLKRIQLFDNALKIEKQQIINAFNNGTKTRYTQGAVILGLKTLPKNVNTGEDYYNNNFK